MSRHALRGTRTPRRALRVILATVLILALAGAAMLKLDLAPGPLRSLSARAPLIGAHCPSSRLTTTTVEVTVAPELNSLMQTALAPVEGRTLDRHECVNVTIQSQAPAATVAGAQILPLDRAPDIWIPDSSLWLSRVPNWKVNLDGSFASSPVVVATSRGALDQLGWTRKTPSWRDAMTSPRPLAVPDIAENAAGLSAVIALWQSLGMGAEAQQALAGTVLAAGRAGVPSEQEAIAKAQSGSSSAPLLPTSEQQVGQANLVASNRFKLVSVRPTGGSPSLDYPVLTTERPAISASGAVIDSSTAQARERAVRAVVAQLLSSQSARLVKADGFRIPDTRGSASPTPVPLNPTGAAGPAAAGSAVEGLTSSELAALVERITLLSAPSRMLVIFDLSGSMAAPAGNGQSRIAFASTAATLTGNLLTDKAQVGIWGFARDLKGKQNILKIDDVGELGSGPKSHRQRLNTEMAGAATQLGGNGTALYSTAIAGMTQMDQLFDPRASNAVVIFTDGANDDPGGPSLKKTLSKLDVLYDSQKPVRLICIGIGSGADLGELRQLSAKAGGVAYASKDPTQLPNVLFQAMNSRK